MLFYIIGGSAAPPDRHVVLVIARDVSIRSTFEGGESQRWVQQICKNQSQKLIHVTIWHIAWYNPVKQW